jgi:aldehyde:ferredoxin oxidoreductase
MEIIGKKLTVGYDRASRKQMNPINGKILQVDLTSGQMWVDEHGEAFYRTYIGGRGVVLYYLLSEMPTGADPLGPDNRLIFAPGVLTGTVLPGSGRHGVGAKSPLTNALASGEAGGWWGTQLKRSGFDGIVFRGKAESPVYLSIIDGQVEIHDARDLWGKLTGETEDLVRQELDNDKLRVATIGPAGENLVRYACVIHDAYRAAGRSGLGAVMGSKNLKAVAVQGSAPLGLADRSQMNETIGWIASDYKTSMAWAVEGGTSGSTKYLHDIGSTPVRNFTEPVFEDIERVDGAHLFERMLKGRDTCATCPVHCKVVLEHEDDRFPISSQYGGPEYESIGALGPLCEIGDPVAVAKANELCEAYGLDTISTGVTIAFVMEALDRGLLELPSGEEPGPRFGDGDALVESVKRIALRQGLGDRMAEGSLRMAQEMGESALSMVVATKGQELPMHDPRLKNAFGLGYALSATGADHMHNMDDTFVNNPDSPNSIRLRSLGIDAPLPLYGLSEEKIRAFIFETAFMNFMDCAVVCDFYPYVYEHMVSAVNGATGWDITQEEIVEIGTRIVNMGRAFLVREGFSSEDDMLPERVFQAHDSGPTAGMALTPEELQEALQTYYRLMGWDSEGHPLDLADWIPHT